MKEGWEIKNLSDVCDFQNGFAFKSNTYKDTGTLIVRITNIQDESIDLSKVVYIDPKDYRQDLSKYKVIKGDLLIAMSGATTGKIGIHNTEGELLLNQRVGKFEPKKSLDKTYLLNFLKTKVEESLLISAGSAQPNLSTEQIKQFTIPIPPLTEQKQIVAILDKAFAAIDQAKVNIEKNIVNAKELFQSKLNEIFSQKGDGWVEKSLGEVCEVLNGYAFKSKDTVEHSSTQLLRMGNLYKNILDLSRKPVFYPDRFSETYSIFLLKEGDLIMSLTGTVDKTDYGYTVKIPKTEVKLLLNQRIMKIEINEENYVTKDYLHNYLLSSQFLSRLYDTASGTRQANLSSRTILTLKIRFPKNIAEQNSLIDSLEIVKKESTKLETIYKQKLANLEELKKSILQKAFKGELVD